MMYKSGKSIRKSNPKKTACAILSLLALTILSAGGAFPLDQREGSSPSDEVAVATPRLEVERVEDGVVWRDGTNGLVRRFVPCGFTAGDGDARAVFKRDGSAVSAADALLAAHADRVGITAILSQLEVRNVREGLASAHVRYRRVVRGFEVVPGGVAVHMNRAGSPLVTSVTIDPRLEAAPAAAPVAEADAIRAATRGAIPSAGEIRADLVYREEPDRLQLTWRIVFFTEWPLGEWEVWIDALSGEEIKRVNQARHVDGSGTIWTPNPVNVLATENLYDLGDADQTVFDDAYEQVILRDLDPPVGGSYYLSGPWVKISDEESPQSGIPSAVSADSFQTTRENDLFEAVMAYYHIDNSQRHLQSLGFTGDKGVAAFPIPVDPHGLGGDDNSHYLPGAKRLAFGDGNVDDAEDADVVVHEYGHAIQDNQVPGWSGSGEMGAMGEGFCDYWAESYTQRIGVTYGLGQVFDWDRGPADGFWDGRRVDTEKIYPDDMGGGIHLSGEIWSGALWDIRKILGGEASDRTIIESHFFVDVPAGYEEGALAVMSADQALTGGANGAVIFAKFHDRGILQGSDEPPVLSAAVAPATIDSGETLPLSVHVDAANAVYKAELLYSFNSASEETLALSKSEDIYSVTLEPPADTDLISYYYRVEDVTGLASTSPSGAPASRHSTVVGEGTAVAEISITGGIPNPSNGLVLLRLNTATSVEGTVTVLSPSGRQVALLFDGPLAAGPHELQWNGTDDGGSRVATGIYTIYFRAGSLSDVARITLLRSGSDSKMVRAAGPNPFVNSISFTLEIPRPGDVQFEVYDLAGRLVVDLAGPAMRAGRNVVEWDGKNSDGKRVAQGIYFYRLALNGIEERGRIVHLLYRNE